MLEILFIGTGDAFGSGGRRNSAILVRDGAHSLLLDCGPTTLQGVRQLDIDPLEIDTIAISHFHGDHASGTPFLLLDYLYGRARKRPLEICGPPGIEVRLRNLTTDLSYDNVFESEYPIRFREYRIGAPMETGNFTLLPYAAFHHPETRPHMLRVETDHRALFFTGDTGWYESLPEDVGDVQLLISECTLMEKGFDLHLSHEQLLTHRARMRCERIVLTHLGGDVLAHRAGVEFETADDGLKLTI